MQPKKSPSALFQYVLIVMLVVLLAYLLTRHVSPLVFTTVFLLGVILAASPSIVMGIRSSQGHDKTSPQADLHTRTHAVKSTSARDGYGLETPAARHSSSAESDLKPDAVTASVPLPKAPGWSLRPIADADLLEVAALLRKAFEEYRGVLNPPSGAHEETAEQLRLVLKDSRALVAVVDHRSSENAAPAQRIVGCVFYQFLFDHVYLFRLAVLPDYRRRGIGRALIEQVEQITRYAGIHLIQLGVRTQLPANQAYYEKQGYQVLRYEAHMNYPEPTIVILQKQI